MPEVRGSANNEVHQVVAPRQGEALQLHSIFLPFAPVGVHQTFAKMFWIYMVRGLALSVVFLGGCLKSDPGRTRLSQEVESSMISFELRQLHSRQRLGPIVVTGKSFDDLYTPWFFAVYEIAPTIEGSMKMAPHGVVRGGIPDRNDPVRIDLTGRSPLESLNLICASFDAYFKYSDDYSVVVAASKEALATKVIDAKPQVGVDPFSSSE